MHLINFHQGLSFLYGTCCTVDINVKRFKHFRCYTVQLNVDKVACLLLVLTLHG